MISGASVARIEAPLTAAQQRGTLRVFHGEYRRRREAALAVGRGLMSYQRVGARVRAAIAASSPRSASLDLAMIARVLNSALS